MRKFQYIRIILLGIVFLLLSGCWSSMDIQNQHYVTSLGVDYDGETYTLYAQIIRFENVAGLEGQGAKSQGNNTYVGIGKGNTLNTAVDALYNSAQVRIDWGQTKAVVTTFRTLQLLDGEFAGHIYRYPENRYNTWLYVTEEPIDEIFLSNSFYDRPSIYSILHKPMSSYKQHSAVPPIEMFKFLSAENEPDRIIIIPVIGFDQKQWKTNEEQLKLLTITGAYFESYNDVKKNFPIEQIKGMRWIDERLLRTMLVVKDGVKNYAVLTIDYSKVRKKAKLVNGEVKFTIKATYRGSMNEYINQIEYHKMIEIAREEIKKEIIEVYELGVKEQVDFFELMHTFRLKHPAEWKRMTNYGQKFILDEQSIEHIDIDLVVPFNGKYKRIK